MATDVLVSTSRALLAVRDEASVIRLAALLARRWREAGDDERRGYVSWLAEALGPDPTRLSEAVEQWRSGPSPTAARRLFEAAEPPRQELFRRLNVAEGGTSVIVDLRATVLALSDVTGVEAVDADLAHLLRSWFNLGFLRFERLTWSSPSSVLERLIHYEAVHEIQGWDDLRRRLADDRRCFALFHPALPGEPLIFVTVALCDGLAGSVTELLDDAPVVVPNAPDTAIFYSITNCQPGLRGISFGAFLLDQVIEQLRSELPSLEVFSTLSPIPGLRHWLEAGGAGPELAAVAAGCSSDDPPAEVARLEEHRAALLAACARYLTTTDDRSRPLDPVGRFHLRNGARVERVNWAANATPTGLDRSLGMMVNYRYVPDELLTNHEALVNAGEVARSADVEALLRTPPD